MGDMREVFDAMKEDRIERRETRRQLNLEYLEEHLMTPTAARNGSTVFLYRPPKYRVKADFYPGTGRWRSGGRTYRGGAKAFVAWMKKAR
jgi:hypothetical protein